MKTTVELNPVPHLRRTGRMIAVDTNLLVYAHREDSSWHRQADALIAQLAE